MEFSEYEDHISIIKKYINGELQENVGVYYKSKDSEKFCLVMEGNSNYFSKDRFHDCTISIEKIPWRKCKFGYFDNSKLLYIISDKVRMNLIYHSHSGENIRVNIEGFIIVVIEEIAKDPQNLYIEINIQHDENVSYLSNRPIYDISELISGRLTKGVRF